MVDLNDIPVMSEGWAREIKEMVQKEINSQDIAEEYLGFRSSYFGDKLCEEAALFLKEDLKDWKRG